MSSCVAAWAPSSHCSGLHKKQFTWEKFRQITLSKNMRTEGQSVDHDNWLIKLGNGELSSNDELDDSIIEVPSEFIEHGDIIDAIFGESIAVDDVSSYADRAILTPKNDDVHELMRSISSLGRGNCNILEHGFRPMRRRARGSEFSSRVFKIRSGPQDCRFISLN